MITYWHNPRCSKSRAGLAFFEEKGVDVSIRLYQNEAPTLNELTHVLELLGVPAIAMMRSKDAMFKDLGLSPEMDDATLVAAMAAHPALIERPIAFSDVTARIGRPTEAFEELL